MVFSEPFFLFVFLPLALVVINLSAGRGHNVFILAFSLIFYYWSSGLATLVLVASIVVNWLLGLWLGRSSSKAVLSIGVAFNLLVLCFFKYAFFFSDNILRLVDSVQDNPFLGIVLPIGISFYTFQGVAYLVDIWRKEIPAEKNLLTFAAYLSFFPQLVAGPIVRYKDVIHDYHQPKIHMDNVSAGLSRFAHGLLKKVLIADNAGLVADACFAVPPGELTMADAWLGALAYAIQIYFDFSAYSDMAIGLGLVCGFRFLENFKHPYTSATITDFWRRWHISLSTWFRDYLYIPLGGNRVGRWANLRNLVVVFLVTGLWHGAAWNFVLWGLYHGLFLIGEKLVLAKRAAQLRSFALRIGYMAPVIIIGWVLFRAEDLAHAMVVYSAMFDVTAQSLALSEDVRPLLSSTTLLAMGVGVLAFAMPRDITVGMWLAQRSSIALEWVKLAYVAFAVICGAILALQSDFSPFLYFRF
ncbi:hypothetical protein A3709_15235 [Halioglobus sp. HI00S01]|uniref:MBOAT family O-acyltransferase n=1 Tax=Halioglobus sp. HI00S01 TaxID=1822214 RepID=UPI0007C3A961|nr:MBOAT family protein [Halioglobus sp. HI00S01]KZX59261.1 hypothetical protein A3709_15235 [Halioglobus sp. HI00S01]